MRMTPMWNMRLASLIQVAGLGLLGTFETVRMKDLGMAEAQIGMVLGIEHGLMIFTALAWGRVGDNTRLLRRCLTISTVGMMVTLGWFSQAETFRDFVGYGILRGLFMTGILGLMPALALANLDPTKPGSGFGGYRRYGSIGFLFASSGLPLLVADIPTMAIIAMMYVPASIWFVRNLKDPVPDETAVDAEPAPIDSRALKWFLVASFFVSFADPGSHGFFNTYARDLGASVKWVGVLTGMTGAIALLTLGYMGRLADRIGASKLLVLGFTAQALRMLTNSIITDSDWLWVPHLFHTFGFAGKEVATLLFLSALLGRTRLGMASSLLVAMRMTGMMAGSFLMGWLAEEYGYPVMFRVIAGCVGLGMIALWLALRARSSSSN
ncbi:MFS transporter [Opitutaceae bacterium]|nr:MFS transporter [Opitutaceae bacterium]